MIEAKQKIQKTVQNYSFFLDDLLGEGYSSQVYKGINNCTKQIVAIKVINFQTLTSPISQTLLKNEINILKQINHQNIMRVYEVFESRNNTYIICEYCKDGDLANILEKQKLSQIDILSIFSQVAEGIKALHDQKIIHRDIKPANILKSNGIYKLSDFGFAIIENDYESIIKKFSVGTPVYMAPETVHQNQYSEKSDIWSLGVVLYLMLFKEAPFNLKKDFDLVTKEQQIHQKIRNEKNLIKKIKDLLIGMLQIDPQKRFDIIMVQKLLKQQKKLNLNQHSNIPCKIIRRVSACDLTDFSDNENALANPDLSKPLKTLPDEISTNEIIKEPSQNRQGQTHRLKGEYTSTEKVVNTEIIRTNTKINTIQILTDEKQRNNRTTQNIDNNYQTCPPLNLSSEKSKKQIKINIPQSDFKLKLEINKTQKSIENSEGQQNSNSNSTKDTIKNNSSSNCQSSQNQISMNSPTVQQQKVQRDVSPKVQNFSLRHLVVSPLKQRNNKTAQSFSVLPEEKDKQNFQGLNFLKNRLKKVENQKSKARTDLSASINSDQDKKNSKQIESEREKERIAIEQLSATIKPTYKFLVFLNNVLKNFDQINTEEKQKCYFLIRKLLALKASAIKKFCPQQIQIILECWIDSFQLYYEKVFPVFYTSQDRKFGQYFNNNLEQFTKGFSQVLFNSLQTVNQQLLSKELLIIQEVIHENIKQFNDPILFARRWANDQS